MEVRRGSREWAGALVMAVITVAALPNANALSVASAATQAQSLSWQRQSSQQTLPSVLASIEERLRSLESVKYTTNKWDMFLEILSRKLESLDVRTRAIQMKLDHLETVTQNLLSYEMKNELLNDQLQRKFQTNQDGIIHRISFTENRLEASITKLQGSVELQLEKYGKLQEGVETKLETVSSTVNEMKNRVVKLEESRNATNRAIDQFMQNSISETNTNVNLNKISQIIEGFEKQVNRSMMLSDQNYGPSIQNNPSDLEVVKTEVINEANKIGNKISNMYNDLWRRIISMESMMKEIKSTNNITKLIARDDFQSLIEDQRCSDTIENLMDITIGGLSDSLQRKIGDINHKIDNNFHAANSMVMGACHSLHQDRNQLETKLTLVLEKILEKINNGSSNVEKRQVEVLESLKSHNNQIVRTVAYNTNLVKRLADDTSIEHKNIDNTILEVAVLINQMLSYKHDSADFSENNHEPCCGQESLSIPKLNRSDEEEYNTSNSFMEKFDEGSSSLEEPFPTNLNALVANYSEGVLSIITELPKENGSNEKKSKETSNPDINRKDAFNEDDFFISLGLLNKTVSTKNLSVIIGEPKITNLTVPGQNETTEGDKIFDNNLSKVKASEVIEKRVYTEEKSDNFEDMKPNENIDINIGTLLMLYLKALKGHLTKEKFLYEANPKKPYGSIEELIKDLKKNKKFPSDFMKELEEWDKETQYKISDDLIDNKDNENNNEDYYIDGYDGM